MSFEFAFILMLVVGNMHCLKLRVVTWNVADNKLMPGGFSYDAVDTVLGLSENRHNQADVYAIGLQEQCWKCNKGSFPLIAGKFLDRIKTTDPNFEVVHIKGTRESKLCQLGCKVGSHGTTLLIVIARIGLVRNFKTFSRVDGCSSAAVPNVEKGIAALQVELHSGLRLCFGSAHLDSSSSKTRRACLKRFLADADEKLSWSTTCSGRFLFGDFNTRTSAKGKGSDGAMHIPENTDFSMLKVTDELLGVTPYGTDTDWDGNLMAYINSVQGKVYTEGPLKFVPTYSVLPARKCSSQRPCYRSNRPLSWTDRIIFTSEGRLLKYQAIKTVYGDHFPVYAVIEIS